MLKFVCSRCSSKDIKVEKVRFKNNDWHVRGTCLGCKKMKYLNRRHFDWDSLPLGKLKKDKKGREQMEDPLEFLRTMILDINESIPNMKAVSMDRGVSWYSNSLGLVESYVSKLGGDDPDRFSVYLIGVVDGMSGYIPDDDFNLNCVHSRVMEAGELWLGIQLTSEAQSTVLSDLNINS